MNINATLLGQMITFALFVLFTMKFVWPHITKALADRQGRIAEGLAAADRGKYELEQAREHSTQERKTAKEEATKIIEHAYHQANQIIEQAKVDAREKAEHLLIQAQGDIQQEMNKAKQQLRQYVADMVVGATEKVIGRQLDEKNQHDLIQNLIEQL